MDNYEEILNIKFHQPVIIIIASIIFIITLILSIIVKTYSSYDGYASWVNGKLIISVPIENSDAVNDGEYLLINNEKYLYNIINISQLEIVNNINYQNYELKVPKLALKENEITKITLYYKKQRIITKIINFIF